MSKPNELIIEKIHNALLTLQDFWDADEEQQQEALEMAANVLRAILNMVEESK